MTIALHYNGHNFDKTMTIYEKGKADISWWLSKEKLISMPIIAPQGTIHIFADASSRGWGAHNNLGLSTGGQWDLREASNRINWLEVKACFLGLKSLVAEQTVETMIEAHLDNATAISYINKQGRKISSLNALAFDI